MNKNDIDALTKLYEGTKPAPGSDKEHAQIAALQHYIDTKTTTIKSIGQHVDGKKVFKLARFTNIDGTPIYFDGIEHTGKTGHADITLTLDGKPVFWISYKFNEFEDVFSKIGFQQYTGAVDLYKDTSIFGKHFSTFKKLLDNAFTLFSNLILNENPEYGFKTSDSGNKLNDLKNQLTERFIKKSAKLNAFITGKTSSNKYIVKSTDTVYNILKLYNTTEYILKRLNGNAKMSNAELQKVCLPGNEINVPETNKLVVDVGETIKHIMGKKNLTKNIKDFNFAVLTPSGQSYKYDFYANSTNTDPEIAFNNLLALKAIYGKDYQKGAAFGKDNVNCVLQSTWHITFVEEVFKPMDKTDPAFNNAIDNYAIYNYAEENNVSLEVADTKLQSLKMNNSVEANRYRNECINAFIKNQTVMANNVNQDNVTTVYFVKGDIPIEKKPKSLDTEYYNKLESQRNVKQITEELTGIFINPNVPNCENYLPIIFLKYTSDRNFLFDWGSDPTSDKSPTLMFGIRPDISPKAIRGDMSDE